MDKKEQLRQNREKIVRGLEESYRRLVEFKRYKKSPLIVSRNGKVVEIPYDEIPPTTVYLVGDDKETKK